MKVAEQVSAGLQAYPAYKDSGVAWIGEIPAAWEVRRLKQVMQLNPRKSEAQLPNEVSFVPMEAVSEDGGMDTSVNRFTIDVETGYTYFRDGDLVVAKVTPCFENGKGAVARGLLGGVGFGSTEFHVLRGTSEMTTTYAYYLTMTTGFRKLGEGFMYGAGGQKRVPTGFMRDVEIPVPSAAEQQTIVDHLDTQLAQIDELTGEVRASMDLMRQHRAALITAAVTGKIDVRDLA